MRYERTWRTERRPLDWDEDAPSGGPIAYVALCMSLIGLAVVVGQMVRAWIQ